MVQWLRLRIPNAGVLGSIPGQETRSHMSQLRVCVLQQKIPCDTMETQRSQTSHFFKAVTNVKGVILYQNKNTVSHGPCPYNKDIYNKGMFNKRVPFPDMGCLEGDHWYCDSVTVMKSLPFSCLSLFVNKAREEGKKRKNNSGPLNS